MMRHKGASHEEALRLKHWKQGITGSVDAQTQTQTETDPGHTGSESGDELTTTPDDSFLEEYRQKRLQEIKATTTSASSHNQHNYGQVMLISRQDWTRQVNDASQNTWVVVSLTCSDTERTGCMDKAMEGLASKFDNVKFVVIPHHQAIANWPEEHLPTSSVPLRYDAASTRLTADDHLGRTIGMELAQLGVLDTDLVEEPKNRHPTRSRFTPGSYRGTVFGGTGYQLKTRAEGDDTNNDYDDVD
jgi:hypothetical protein